MKSMESNGGDEVMVSGSDETKFSEATVEIKIKTLDSQTYTLRVDKCVPIPALKEQIATVTGVLSEQQRLICRGKVLKDDQLLSAYHVEDGHTLHMVVRQPIQASLDSSLDHSANDPASSSGRLVNQAGPSVVVGTFNISEPGDGVLPDLSRIVSAVLGSFGVTNIGSNNEGADFREAAAEGLSRIPLGGLRNSGGHQTEQATSNGQSNPGTGGTPFSASLPLDPLQLPVIPDSLTTLSQYLTRMRHEFGTDVRSQSNSSQVGDTLRGDGGESDTAMHSPSGGLPTPASLAEVIVSTRQLLSDQAADCLSQLARQLEDQANVTDPLARMTTQSNAIRAGVLLQHLGALLLELGRTTMTLRMGQTSTESVVNAGPAVFISSSGPNPIMVQPLNFQAGTSFGAIPWGTVHHPSGLSAGSTGSGFLPRNIDIRIRTASQREPTGVQQSPVQSNQMTPDTGSFVHQDATGASETPSSTRESGVRVVPIRTVVAALPASVRRSGSDTSRGSMGLFYPVLARVQHVSSGNLNNQRDTQSADGGFSGGLDSEQQPNVDSTVPREDIGLPGADANLHAGDGTQNGQGFSTHLQSGIDQLLRSIFPGENIHVSDVNLQGMGMSSATSNSGTNPGATAATFTQEVAPVMDDGLFLSNLLRQIMPLISENTDSGSSIPSAGEGDTDDRATQASSPQAEENSDRGTMSRRRGNSSSSPSSKRQRRD